MERERKYREKNLESDREKVCDPRWGERFTLWHLERKFSFLKPAAKSPKFNPLLGNTSS